MGDKRGVWNLPGQAGLSSTQLLVSKAFGRAGGRTTQRRRKRKSKPGAGTRRRRSSRGSRRTKRARLVKGSAAAKRYMASIRRKRKRR